MSEGTFPKPYVNDVKQDDNLCVYVDFKKMGIGARTSGLPTYASEGPGSLVHVGDTTGKGRR
jgi:hypothetical protein